MTWLVLFSSGFRGFSLTIDLDLLARLWTCLLFSIIRSFSLCGIDNIIKLLVFNPVISVCSDYTLTHIPQITKISNSVGKTRITRIFLLQKTQTNQKK